MGTLLADFVVNGRSECVRSDWLECRIWRSVLSATGRSRTSTLRVGESSLHQECLKCASCRTPLTESCFSKFGQFYCRQDFYRMFGPRCSSCQLVFAETDK